MTPWTVARHAPRFVEFSRQEYWSGLPFLTPGNLPRPELNTQTSCFSCSGVQIWSASKIWRQTFYHQTIWEDITCVKPSQDLTPKLQFQPLSGVVSLITTELICLIKPLPSYKGICPSSDTIHFLLLKTFRFAQLPGAPFYLLAGVLPDT